MVSDGRRRAALLGARRAAGVPGIVLFASFVGFGAFARAAGLDFWQTVFMTFSVFALPGQVVLVDQIDSGATLLAATIAVTITAVRLMPMTVAILPVLRGAQTPLWQQTLMSHFVAATVWIESMRRIPELDRADRVPYYLGLALVLWPLTMSASGVGHLIAGEVPPNIAAALLLLTPFYFLFSLIAAIRERMDLAAVIGGLALGPVFYLHAPGFDLLWTGLVAGTVAWAVGRRRA